ncbi:hypothetical protein, variant [Saprolegnia diclina VS20]|uniref:PHD-type domain-containing protein n=1 Tax=Saprolegnia diclina (strain VS20) TaxID=1156394 RepID=T0RP26_SAPDV|nr:hypothetical protein, variant [Saprolegnia diclina VS20]EQC34188.1 hypothetical protein, variant [Saprolegnia diclina VS20]|eukprot:XP_008612500.1 hypothetical protein, variant [Saprolegnia diclina VS20]
MLPERPRRSRVSRARKGRRTCHRHGRDVDETDASAVTLTNLERHRASHYTQCYNGMIRTTFVTKSLAPLLDKFESIDAFRRPRKRYTLVDPLPKLRADANSLRRDAVLALTRHTRTGGRFSALKGDLEATTDALAQVRISRLAFASSLHNSRCEYCSQTGGELACVMCNVVAHTACYLEAWKGLARRGPVSFEVQGDDKTKWICTYCEEDLQDEHEAQTTRYRHNRKLQKEMACARLITGYARMSKEARLFVRKKECAVRIQAHIRGKLARRAFNAMQRLRIRPYVVNLMSLHGLGAEGDASAKSPRSTTGDDDACTETRLPNGFLCNPFVVFHIVAEHDDEAQHFESAIQRGSNEVAWNEAIFVPGVDGNVTMCFTVLSKNGPNNFFLGQGTHLPRMVRMSGTEIWRYGANLELLIRPELEDIGSITRELTLSVHIKQFADPVANCGYMQSINSIDSAKGNSRWCVLADGIFRIYR